MFYIKDDSIIISKTPHKEYDGIVTILTRKTGKIKAIAKGLYRPTSRLSGSLEPGNCGSVYLSSNGTFFRFISFLPHKIPETGFKKFPKEFLWALRFVGSFSLFEISDELWSDICTIDNALNNHTGSFRIWFALRVLEHLGYFPNMETCAICQKQLITQAFLYQGSLFCQACKRESFYKITSTELSTMRSIAQDKKPKRHSPALAKLLSYHIKHIAVL